MPEQKKLSDRSNEVYKWFVKHLSKSEGGKIEFDNPQFKELVGLLADFRRFGFTTDPLEEAPYDWSDVDEMLEELGEVRNNKRAKKDRRT